MVFGDWETTVLLSHWNNILKKWSKKEKESEDVTSHWWEQDWKRNQDSPIDYQICRRSASWVSSPGQRTNRICCGFFQLIITQLWLHSVWKLNLLPLIREHRGGSVPEEKCNYLVGIVAAQIELGVLRFNFLINIFLIHSHKWYFQELNAIFGLQTTVHSRDGLQKNCKSYSWTVNVFMSGNKTKYPVQSTMDPEPDVGTVGASWEYKLHPA